MLVNTSLSSTYAPMVAEAQARQGAAATSPARSARRRPIRPPIRCSSARRRSAPISTARLAIAFVKETAKEPVRIGFAGHGDPDRARARSTTPKNCSQELGMTPVGRRSSRRPTPDYTPFATKLKDGNPNWVYSWSPWVSQVRTLRGAAAAGLERALHHLGAHQGRGRTRAHQGRRPLRHRHQCVLAGRPADPCRDPRRRPTAPTSSTR